MLLADTPLLYVVGDEKRSLKHGAQMPRPSHWQLWEKGPVPATTTLLLH
jgi:hypothetical protein